MPTQTLQEIRLSDIILSGDNQRQIDQKSEDIQELAASIKGGGVECPVEVSPDPKKKGKYVLIAGERRYVASQLAGAETVPAIVISEVSDAERVGRMAVENMFRKDLKPMEQAAQLALWMERTGGDVKVIAERLGKKERWVRERANIIGGLSKQWRVIFADLKKHPGFAGWTISHLLTIARLPEHLQAEMYEGMTRQYAHPEQETAMDLEERIARVMHLLSKAKWDVDDETLVPKAGACSKCTKRTGHQPLLWFDSDDQVQAGDQCMDPACYQGKQTAWVARQAKELRDKHPKLVLVAKDNPGDNEATALRDQVGSYLPNWEYSPASKNGKDAVPAMYVDGRAAGKLTYVKLKPQSSGGGSSRLGTGVPTPLKERRQQLDAKRWAQVLVDLREKVEGATVENITWKDKVSGLMAAVAAYSNKRLPLSRHDRFGKLKDILAIKAPEKRQTQALELLWESFKPTLDEELRWMGPVTQTPPEMQTTAKWIADLIGLDAGKMFDEVSQRKGFTVPKSWAKLNADGTPKKEKTDGGGRKGTKKGNKGKADKPAVRACRVCGCTDNKPCIDPDTGEACHWIEQDLCSLCEDKVA